MKKKERNQEEKVKRVGEENNQIFKLIEVGM